jgi:hypothetical protein
MITSLDEMLHIAFYTYNVLLPRNDCIKFVFQFNMRRILRRIYTFHIQCIIKVEDLNALYLEN